MSLVIVIFVGVNTTNNDVKEVKADKRVEKVNKKVKAKEKKNNKKAQKIYKELTRDTDYAYLTKLKLNQNKGKITGVSLWCDDALKDTDTATLKHYFSLAAQVGNQALNKGYEVPYIQVYAGNKRVAKSKISNNSMMIDLRK